MPRSNSWTQLLGVIFCTLLLNSIGCQNVPRKSLLDEVQKNSGKKLNTSQAELRLTMHHAALPLSGIVEAHGDQILDSCNDPTVRKNTLLWKINGIPTIHQAIFQSDPFLAFVDMWVLSVQMRLFFEEGAGKDALGKWHPTAVAGAQEVESIITTLARGISNDGDITAAKKRINKWSRENPIDSLHFIRPTLSVHLAKKIGGKSLGTFEIVDAVAIGVADLSQQMMAYANYLPKQARWQTELLLEGMAGTEKVNQALTEFIRISRDVDRLTVLAETAPGVIATERAIILKALSRDLNRTLAVLDKQRIATLYSLEEERVAVMADVKTERAGMSADITAERIALLTEIERQRQDTLARTEAMGRRMLEDALEDSNTKIDRFFVRTLQVGGLLVFVVLCFWAAAIYYIHGRRRQG